MSTPITLTRGHQYRFTKLVYNGLNAQMPRGTDLGYPWSYDNKYMIIDSELVYRLNDQNVSVEDACFAVYNKTLIQMCDDVLELDPKIWKITDPQIREAREDHRTIDYRTALTVPLYPDRTTLKGEVTRVDWYADKAKTDKILTAEIVYERDPFGFATKRTTTRKWVMNNGDYHPLVKVTEKDYTINLEDQISEGKRRRENIVNTTQRPVLQGMMETLLPQGMTQTQILLLGRSFMDQLEVFFNKFIGNSSTVTTPGDPNLGRKQIVVEFERLAATEHPWLNNISQSLGGISILAFLVREYSI